jgi:hypothetical protein
MSPTCITEGLSSRVLDHIVVPGALLLWSNVSSIFVIPRPAQILLDGINNLIGCFELGNTKEVRRALVQLYAEGKLDLQHGISL